MELKPAHWDIVPDLLNILKEQWPETKTSWSILNGFKSHVKTCPQLEAHLLTPDGKLDRFATFLLVLKEYTHGFYIESLNPNLEEFALALRNCPYIDFTKRPKFCTLHPRLWPIFDFIWSNNYGIKMCDNCLTTSFHFSIEDAKNLAVNVPDDVYLSDVKSEHAEKINDLWPHGQGEKTFKEVLYYIALRPSFGLFKKDTNELVAWCLYLDYGGPGLLQVDEKFKRKGYGLVVLAAMTKYLASVGVEAQALITAGNTPSVGLFKKVGYVEGPEARWITMVESVSSN